MRGSRSTSSSTALAEPALLAHDLRDAEERLFALADPEPLATPVLAPRSRRATSPRSIARRRAGDAERAGAVARADALARHVDADLADLVSRATTGLWRRAALRRERASRRPWIVAGGLAGCRPRGGAAVADGRRGPATADVPARRPAADAAAPRSREPVRDAAATAGAAMAPHRRSGRGHRPTCSRARTACARRRGVPRAASCEDPSPRRSQRARSISTPMQRTSTLLDDFGGVAVLRVEPRQRRAGRTARRRHAATDDRWLLRDVHDIAKQPCRSIRCRAGPRTSPPRGGP